MTKLLFLISPSPCALSSSRMANTVPRPVAASRPRLPCSHTGCAARGSGWVVKGPGQAAGRCTARAATWPACREQGGAT